MTMRNQMTIKTYSELIQFETFEERFDYLCIHGKVGEDTFGFDRYLNQMFYTSPEWRSLRNDIITRDLGCDLGVKGFDIIDQTIIIHHMNPITEKQIEDRDPDIFNPEYLITVTHKTHNAIHYGSNNKLKLKEDREPGDTCLWR